ncbi:permease [Granulicella sibirica]|uniref:Uncharacterized protein n=1 Tax=Granulicella sibirica TaxID=2479048 RepID=A0A4Q0T020_9BACT|nr:permease [Granulicella sibirica]RXH55650.1 hypothetical protein GRAN_2507 [Granulicella sibirica]
MNRNLSSILHLRARSLVRGNALVLVSLGIAFLLSDFPNNRPNPWIIIPALGALAGTADTIRCMQRQWNFYHGGVILCIYMDLMALVAIGFLLIYPYADWISFH